MRETAVAIVFWALFASPAWSQTQPRAAGSHNRAPWRARVFGEAAYRLVAANPLNNELRELGLILCPPKGTPRKAIERVFGKPFDHDEQTGFYWYKVTDQVSLCADYREEKFDGGGFWHRGLRESEMLVNTEPGKKIPSGPPVSYNDLLLDLQQKVDNLGEVLAMLQDKRIQIPWHPWRKDAPSDGEPPR